MQIYRRVVQIIDDANMVVSQYSQGLRRISANSYRYYRYNRLKINNNILLFESGFGIGFFMIFPYLLEIIIC